jgi:stage II sporulation protein Q
MREEEKQKSVHPLKTKWYKRKRLIYPAVYLGFAAIILTAVLWYQNDVNQEAQPNPSPTGEVPNSFDKEEDLIPVTNSKEVFKMPVADEGAVSIMTKYYDTEASAEDQQAAIVVYNNTYFQSTGIDLVADEGEAFDVTASLSGTVVKAEKDPILGHVVVIKHANGVTTHYSSLESLQVEEGNTVVQGEVLGQAGLSEYNKDAGVHAHFEIRKDGSAVNPTELFGQLVTAIPDNSQATEETEDASSTDVEEEEESSTDQTEEEPAEDTSNEDETTENNA